MTSVSSMTCHAYFTHAALCVVRPKLSMRGTPVYRFDLHCDAKVRTMHILLNISKSSLYIHVSPDA